MAEASGFGANVSSSNKDFWSPAFITRGIEQDYINPKLIWDGLFTDYVGSTQTSFRKPIYMVDSSGNRITPEVSDARRSPVVYVRGTFVPKIGEDTYDYTTDGLVPYTLGIDIDEDMRSNPMGDMQSKKLRDSFDTFAASWAQHMNSEVLANTYGSTFHTVDGGATLADYMDHSDNLSYENTNGYICGDIDAGWEWDTDGADYITDLLNLKTAGMAQAESVGFESNLDSMAMHITVMEDLVLWGQTNGKTWEISPYQNRMISSIQGWKMFSLSNVDGLSSSYWDHVLFWDSRVTPGTTVYWTGADANYSRWGEDAKLRMGVQDYGVDQGNRLAYVARGDYKTFINPTSEYYFGSLEVY
jgi:hypothetical protein